MLSYHDIIELGLALGPPKLLSTLCFVKHKQAEVRCILLFSNLSLGPNGVHTLVSFISYNLRAQASLVGKWESCSPPELNHQKKNEKEKERRLITGGCFYAIITRIKEPQNYNKIWDCMLSAQCFYWMEIWIAFFPHWLQLRYNMNIIAITHYIKMVIWKHHQAN